MSNEKFLEKVAEVALNRSQAELMETVIVFPNKRPEIFLKKHLKEKVKTGFWIPDIRSIEEFIIELSPITPQDPMLTWFELFDIHKNIEGNKARQPDEFIEWAPTMLNDFNDADLALADIRDLFTFLSKAKALERWHPDGGELTNFEKAYLDFYQKLLQYYNSLKKSLSAKQMGTKGMVYREVAESIATRKDFPWKQIIFAGFNALTPAEEMIISELRKRLAVTLLWDADEYYIYPKKHNLPWQEAGLYLNKLFKKFKINNPQWIENNLTENEKTISMVASPKQISQVKFTGQLLEQWNSRPDSFTPTDTAIVLADEKLLIPLLTSLPSESLSYNVTMGYPLALSQLAQFVTLWIDLLVKREQRQSDVFNTVLILSLLQSQVLRLMLRQPDKIIREINKYNTAFISSERLKEFFTKSNSALFDILFNVGSNTKTISDHLLQLINNYKTEIDKTSKTEGRDQFDTRYPMIRQQVSSVLLVLKKMHTILTGNEKHINLKVFQRLFSRLVSGSEISLKGEPLNGIQIMGMLETRLLDFKKLIILSANEGHLPKSNMSESFIPFDIRREYNLPLPDEKNAIFAYYFFRLLQRADEVVLVYNSEPGDLGGGEKSRFLFQLEIEAAKANTKLKINEQTLKINTDNEPDNVLISIEKDETTLNKLNEIGENGFSPSALNQYIDCSLKFYFARLLKLNPPDELRTSIEADVFGNIVHKVLEEIYKPDLNKTIDTARLARKLKSLDSVLNESLKTTHSTGDIHHGKNLLIVEVIRKYIERFIQKDIENLNNEPRILLGIEEKLDSSVTVSENRTIRIKGVIDRIDKSGNVIRISDYKTGGVKKSDLSFKEWDKLLTDRKYAKAFQTLAYGWLFKQNYPQEKSINVGVFSLRNISEGFISPKFPEDTAKEWQINFKEILVDLLEKLFNPNEPFVQTNDKKSCEYCDFKDICNR
jgi:hypothetical protein